MLDMHRISVVLISGLLLASNALAAVPIPANDPFYFPPSGFASQKPGYVFRGRAAPSGTQGVNATQILYRTTGANGEAAATVATVLVNLTSTISKTQVAVYNPYEDAAWTGCAPSYSFSAGDPTTAFGAEDGSNVPMGLANGWTIVIPDYEGINSSFSAGHLEGRQVLDSLRAALNYKPLGISPTANLGGYGYSGGAIASGWAAALQKSYAPELNIKGWAFGGTPANITGTLLNLDGGFYAGFAFAGTAGQLSAYPQFNAVYQKRVTANGVKAIAQVRSQCAPDDLIDFAYHKVLDPYYITGGAAILSDPTVKSILAMGMLGTVKSETPITPILMYHSKADEVIPYGDAYAAYQAWCANGAPSINFVTGTAGAGHLGFSSAYGPTAVAWLKQRLAGVPAPVTGCVATTTSVSGGPFRKRVAGRVEVHGEVDVVARFGEGDYKIRERMEEQRRRGEKVDGYWSFARDLYEGKDLE